MFMSHFGTTRIMTSQSLAIDIQFELEHPVVAAFASKKASALLRDGEFALKYCIRVSTSCELSAQLLLGSP